MQLNQTPRVQLTSWGIVPIRRIAGPSDKPTAKAQGIGLRRRLLGQQRLSLALGAATLEQAPPAEPSSSKGQTNAERIGKDNAILLQGIACETSLSILSQQCRLRVLYSLVVSGRGHVYYKMEGYSLQAVRHMHKAAKN